MCDCYVLQVLPLKKITGKIKTILSEENKFHIVRHINVVHASLFCLV